MEPESDSDDISRRDTGGAIKQNHIDVLPH
jgi:3D (Asp-Asp-Asp) domain-containing protein